MVVYITVFAYYRTKQQRNLLVQKIHRVFFAPSHIQINIFFPFYETPRDANLKQAKKKYNLIYIL